MQKISIFICNFLNILNNRYDYSIIIPDIAMSNLRKKFDFDLSYKLKPS